MTGRVVQFSGVGHPSRARAERLRAACLVHSTTTDMAELAAELNLADAAAGLIPGRHLEDERALAAVARILAPVLDRVKVGAGDAA